MINEVSKYAAMLDRVANAVATLPRRAANEAKNFSVERFKQQNWVDANTQAWKKRKPLKNESNKRAGRAVLVDSGRLRRSVRVINVDTDRAVIGTDVPYARAHNEGFRGRVTQRVRAHTRNGHRVKAFTRTMNMNLPQRKFIGSSAILEKRLQRMLTVEITRAIKG